MELAVYRSTFTRPTVLPGEDRESVRFDFHHPGDSVAVVARDGLPDRDCPLATERVVVTVPDRRSHLVANVERQAGPQQLFWRDAKGDDHWDSAKQILTLAEASRHGFGVASRG